MGGVGASPGTVSRTAKKKQRHAFHEIDQAPSAPVASNPPFSPTASQFPGQQGQFGPQHGQFGAQPSTFTPGYQQQQTGSQFPVPANPQFVPGNPPTSQAQYNASSSGRDSSSGQVDPNAIPSIPASRDLAQAHYNTNPYATLAQHGPPPTITDYAVIDQGNVSPKFARLTMYTIPTSQEILNQTALPLAWILQPLAKQRSDEAPVPVLDFGEAGPPRCRRCRTYINPFMTFIQGGGKFVCNMCSFPNEVPPEYFSPVDMSGRRLDREQRPELIRGTVEFVVPKEYWSRPLEKGETIEDRALKWLFLVDVSMEACNRGGLTAFVEGIKKALYSDLSEGEEPVKGGIQKLPKGTKIAIVTFDKEIHFYNLNPSLDAAHMMVMPDLEDPFVPLSTGLFIDPYESRSVIESLLDSLPKMFSAIKNPEPALLPTLHAVLGSMEKSGGRIICSLSSLPTWGPGRLFLREDTKLLGTEKEKALFTTEHQSWRKLANKMVDTGVGLDLFLTPHAYIDAATLGYVSSTTGGDVFFYPNFVTSRDTPRLVDDMVHVVHRETGYNALMKVRCSTGLQVANYSGNFLQRTVNGDLEFGVIDADKSMSVSFSYDGKLEKKVDAHFQAALLYTTREGERRVRCLNIVAAVSDNGKDVLRFVDQDAVVMLMAKEAATKMVDRPLKEIRGNLTEKAVEILSQYRKNFSAPSPPGQLILPEALKEFALFMLALLKTRGLRGGSVSSDMRTHSMRLLKAMPMADLSTYLYPLIIPIHNLAPTQGFPDQAAEGVLSIPPTLRASYSRIEEGGVYLVDNSQTCILWLHAHVSPNLLEDLFGPGIKTLQQLDPYMSEIPAVETHLNAQVRNLVQWLSEKRGGMALKLQLARQGMDGAEYEFAGMLVEDRGNDERAYVDWLVHVHKFVQLEVSGQRQRNDVAQASAAAAQAAAFSGMRPPYW
ncbi:Sec23/Sec24 family protein-like protein [Terfezia claveryi]|nr:Sec23/Sec24 family protein-like protein [Terfezia claveryi]